MKQNNVLMFYAADYLSFHFHFRAYNCAAFSKTNKVVCETKITALGPLYLRSRDSVNSLNTV